MLCCIDMRTALITGTSTGIGLETAITFARNGYRVVAGLRNPSNAPLLTKAIDDGLPITPVQLDVDKDDSVQAAVAGLGAVDVVVNNAGYGFGGAIESVTLEASKAIFETNYFGAIRMIRAVAPGMRERRSGAIINVTSVAGRVTWGCHGHYCATKHALEAVTQALAVEMAPYGVRVAAIEPGVILTAIFSKADLSIDPASPYAAVLGRLMRVFASQLEKPNMPDSVANAILHAVETDKPRLRYLVGADAEAMVAGVQKMSEDAWIALQSEPDDGVFVAKAREAFGADLYNPPSLHSQRSKV